MSSRRIIVGIFALLFTLVNFGTFTQVNAQRKGGGRNKGEEKPAKKGKTRVVIASDATSSTSWTKGITEAELETALVQSGRFIVIAGAARDSLLKQQSFSNSDLVDPAKANQVGKMLDADYLIVGRCITAEQKKGGFSVGRFGSKSEKLKVAVQIQLYDITSGQITESQQYNKESDPATSASVSGVGSNQSELAKEDVYRALMKTFAAEFANRMSLKIPISALVVLVRGNEVAIDAGEAASVKQGMEFEVFTEGEPIRDAAGEILSYDRSVHGKIRITRVEAKLAWGEIVQTFNNGQPDPSPNPARIQRDFAVKQK